MRAIPTDLSRLCITIRILLIFSSLHGALGLDRCDSDPSVTRQTDILQRGKQRFVPECPMRVLCTPAVITPQTAAMVS